MGALLGSGRERLAQEVDGLLRLPDAALGRQLLRLARRDERDADAEREEEAEPDQRDPDRVPRLSDGEDRADEAAAERGDEEDARAPGEATKEEAAADVELGLGARQLHLLARQEEQA